MKNKNYKNLFAIVAIILLCNNILIAQSNEKNQTLENQDNTTKVHGINIDDGQLVHGESIVIRFTNDLDASTIDNIIIEDIEGIELSYNIEYQPSGFGRRARVTISSSEFRENNFYHLFVEDDVRDGNGNSVEYYETGFIYDKGNVYDLIVNAIDETLFLSVDLLRIGNFDIDKWSYVESNFSAFTSTLSTINNNDLGYNNVRVTNNYKTVYLGSERYDIYEVDTDDSYRIARIVIDQNGNITEDYELLFKIALTHSFKRNYMLGHRIDKDPLKREYDVARAVILLEDYVRSVMVNVRNAAFSALVTIPGKQKYEFVKSFTSNIVQDITRSIFRGALSNVGRSHAVDIEKALEFASYLDGNNVEFTYQNAKNFYFVNTLTSEARMLADFVDEYWSEEGNILNQLSELQNIIYKKAEKAVVGETLDNLRSLNEVLEILLGDDDQIVQDLIAESQAMYDHRQRIISRRNSINRDSYTGLNSITYFIAEHLYAKKQLFDERYQLLDGSVTPDPGTDSDVYDFSVTFRSVAEQSPDKVELIINGISYPMDPQGNNWRQGVLFTKSFQDLSHGSYQYYFIGSSAHETFRYPNQGYLELNVSMDSEGWDLAVSGASSVRPSFTNAGDRLNVSGAVVNRGDYTYTNERLTARLFSPEGVELDSDNIIIPELPPNWHITDLDMALRIPQNAEDGTYDIRLEVNPMRDSDPSNNILTLQVRVGEPFDFRQFEIIGAEVDLCADPSKVDWTNCTNTITINGTTLRNIRVSDRTKNIRFDGPDGPQIIREDEIVYWEASGAALAILAIFGDSDPDANVAVVNTARATNSGPQFSERVYVAPKGEQTQMIANRGNGPKFIELGSPLFFIPFDANVNVPDEIAKLREWSSNRPSVQNNGSNWSLDFSIPSSADIGRSWMYIKTDHENRRSYLTEVALQVVGVPKIALSEDEIELSVAQGDTVHAVFQITNNGEERLNWNADTKEEYVILEKSNGRIDPGSSEILTFFIDSNSLSSGLHEKKMWIDSNDPQSSRVALKLMIEVQPMPLAIPSGLTADAGNAKVALTWRANDEPVISGYRIYRGESSDDITLLTEVDKHEINQEYVNYLDLDVQNDSVYYYSVLAFGTDGQVSGLSEIVEARPYDPISLLATVSGTVYDYDDKPLPNVNIFAESSEENIEQTRTDNIGTYHFLLEPGEYNLQFRSIVGQRLIRSEEKQIQLHIGDSITIDFKVNNSDYLKISDVMLNGGGRFLQLNEDDIMSVKVSWESRIAQKSFLVLGIGDQIMNVQEIPFENDYHANVKDSTILDLKAPVESGIMYMVLSSAESESEAKDFYRTRPSHSAIRIGNVELIRDCVISWQVAIGVKNATGNIQTLLLGQSPHASTGISSRCGEYEINTELVHHTFDAWWILPDGQRFTRVDYRSLEPEKNNSWKLNLLNEESQWPVQFRWDPELLPDEHFAFRDIDTQGDYLFVDMHEHSEFYIDHKIDLEIISGEESVTSVANNDMPTEFALLGNYPNPFNPGTIIRYAIPKQSQVQLVVYNTIGQKVATLVNEVKNAGTYSVSFNAEGLSSGVYIYRLFTDEFVDTGKMMFVK